MEITNLFQLLGFFGDRLVFLTADDVAAMIGSSS